MKNKTVLAVAAHADDIDFGCAGAIAVWASQGAKIHYLILTDGSRGSEDMSIPAEKLAQMRQDEQNTAAQILGVEKVHFAGFTDGELINSSEVRYSIVKLIRQLKPDVVITTDPTFIYDETYGVINHPDHRQAGQATMDSVFIFARNSRTFPDLLKQNLRPHRVKDLLLLNFSKGNFAVDITKTFHKKMEALAAHKSQFTDFKIIEEIIKERAEATASQIEGATYAENFVRITLQA